MGFPWGLDFGNQNCVIAIARKGGIDVIEMLASIPTEQVVAMQQSIAKNAHRLAFLHERQYDGDDAIDVLLKGMAFGLPG